MTEIPEHVRSALAGRYDLTRVIGRGGMATVYLARDVRHNRDVAVKVLRPELAASIGTDRFLREIEIAAQLNHPHILPLLDSADIDGVLLYVMPFVDGESLRALLNRRGTLDRKTALEITHEVADALTYAHRKGVVHRDIKPENILLLEGHAVVADFGIAKAISTLAGKELTRTGVPLGTPGYMSPEQAAGLTNLDERTDVYSLACVSYEMLVGDTPGLWLTEDAVRLQRFIDALPDHREMLDRLPGSMEQALVRALAMRTDSRFTTPQEFTAALDSSVLASKPRYSDTEVKDIISRAAEIQLQHPTKEGIQSLGGIQQIGAEVGIPPEHVKEAARGGRPSTPLPMPAPKDPKRGHWFFGAPMSVKLERVIEGEVPESEYLVLLDEIRTAIGYVGQTSTLGKSLAWRSGGAPNQGRMVSVTFTPRAGITRIWIEERIGGMAGGLFGGIIGGGGGGGTFPWVALGVNVIGSPIAGAVLGAMWLGGMYGLARTIFTSQAEKKRRELEELMERLASYASETAVRTMYMPDRDDQIRGQIGP